MAWKIYIQYPDVTIPVQGAFKTEEDARLFYRRFRDTFQRKDGSTGKPIYVEQGKGRGKK